MKHELPICDLGSMGESMAEAIQTCVHCGFCLPGCPTYQVLEQEQDSPRGRILLMKEVMEGNLTVDEAAEPIDRCLGCLACETNCPSGVKYGELISPFRDYARTRRKRTWGDWLRRKVVLATLPFPGRFRLALRSGRFAQAVSFLVPKALKPMIAMVPATVPAQERLREFYPAEGESRGRVGLLTGCAQQVLEPDLNSATIRVLNRNGIDVYVPPNQSCCGALAWHVGEADQARKSAAKLLDRFPEDLDAIVTNAAGCGSGIHEYPLLFRGESQCDQAKSFASRVEDVTSYLAKLELRSPPPTPSTVRVVYHDACHLAHAQGVRQGPRALLHAVEGLELIELADQEICCGSAGTYNIDQPEIAQQLGRQKAERIQRHDCEYVAAANIGCMVQIERYLAEGDKSCPVLHPIQLLDRAYLGKLG